MSIAGNPLSQKVIHLLLLLVLMVSCNKKPEQQTSFPGPGKEILRRAHFINRENSESALKYLDSSFNKLHNVLPEDLFLKYIFKTDYYVFKVKDYQKAMLYVDSNINMLQPLASEQRYNRLYADALLRKGDVLLKQKAYNEAYLHFYKAKSSIKLFRDTCSYNLFLYDFNTRLANVSYSQARYIESARFNVKAINFISHCEINADYAYNIQGIYDNIGISYSRSNMPDSALFYFDVALKVIAEEEQKAAKATKEYEVARGIIYGNQGTAYLQKGNPELAEQKFKQSIAINSKRRYAVQDALITRVKLIDLHVDQGRLDLAAEQIKAVENSPDAFPGADYEFFFLKTASKFEEIRGNKAKALDFLKDYLRKEEIQEQESKPLMATDFSREFELLKSTYDINTLKKENEVQYLYLTGALLVCGMAIVIIYLAYRSTKNANKSIKQSALYNRQLELTLKALEKSNHEYGQVLRVVAHDLKNPISAIHGISSLMISDKERNQDDLEMLELISSSSTNLTNIIHDLLTTKISKDAGGLKKEPVQIQDLLQESISLLKFRAEEKKQLIVVEDQVSCLVNVNRDRIWRVINNLIVNAIKFSPEGKTIIVNCGTTDKDVIVTIKDHGVGIPEDMQDKIFQLFTEAKRVGTSGEEPFGLGLYISKQIVEDHGGKIWFRSSIGQDTTFFFSLPLQVEA